MKKRIFSVLVSIILIFSIICCASVPGSAIFVVDDALIASIVISMCASVILSCGISLVTGNESMYVTAAKAAGAIVWEEFSRDLTYAEILSMFVIENGKAYWRVDSPLYQRLRNFIQNYDFNQLHLSSTIVSDSSSVLTSYSSYTLSQIEGKYAIGSPDSVISFTPSNAAYQNIYTPGHGHTVILSDGTSFHNNTVSTSGQLSLVVLCVNDSGELFIKAGTRHSSPASPQDAINADGSNSMINVFTVFNDYEYAVYKGIQGRFTYRWINDRVGAEISFDNKPIFRAYISKANYSKNCILAGHILVNITDNQLNVPINTNSTGTSIDTPIETDVLNPAIPGNRIGSDQTALIPVPGNFVDPSSGDVLTQRETKNRVKRGQDVGFVPDVGQLYEKTPQDLGVQIVNNVDIQDTVVSPTLNTTYIGENSTTYVIVPDSPIYTPVPDNLDNPVYSSPYPDVINPGNEQITVTANNDVFPTAGVTPTERPSVQVTDNAEIASSAVEGISEIASEAVSDLAQPVGPGDVERNANRMKISSQLLHKFPFCIPYDFYNAVAQFAAPGEVIKFDIPFDIERLNIHYTFHIDLTQFETVAKISRWFFSVSWVVVLILLTRKVIWK